MAHGSGTGGLEQPRSLRTPGSLLLPLSLLLLAGPWAGGSAAARGRRPGAMPPRPVPTEAAAGAKHTIRPKKTTAAGGTTSPGSAVTPGSAAGAHPARAADAAPSDPLAPFRQRVLVIGTKPAPPFAMQDADGTWHGISIDLWREIAKDLKLKFRLKRQSLKQLISEPEAGRLDASVAALTITAKREARIDFTHPFFTSGLGIAVPSKDQSSTWDFVKRIFSIGMMKVLGFLLLLLTVIGVIVWLFERRRNPDEFGGSAAQGIGNGLWFSAVTMTTVGYGDKAPRTLGGRLVGLAWMFASIVIISSFTATITTTLTVSHLESSIKGPKDLSSRRVGTVAHTTSAAYLKNAGVKTRYYPTVLAAMRGVAKGEVDAAVYDAPIMRYLARSKLRGKVQVLPVTFERQDYGFALPNNSKLREEINRVLLDRISHPAYRDIVRRYLGD